MRILVVGGGPAGLYFAYRMKRLDPAYRVQLVEQNPADATYGFGVVFSASALPHLAEADPTVHRRLTERMESWPDLAIVHRDERVQIDGNGFSAIARLDLLRLLQDLCRDAGVEMRFGTRLDRPEIEDYDLVVGADGIGSAVRRSHAEFFRPRTEHLTNRFVWYGTRQRFETLTLTYRTSADGAFVAHHYRYAPAMSTFIVECDARTWADAGFALMTDDESRAYAERVFAPDLGGHGLIGNGSAWRTFPVVSNERWYHRHVVLIGDALRSVHFSIGSGTRLALEDAVALYRAFEAEGADVPAALARYEAERRPVVDKLFAAAAASSRWYESFRERMPLSAYQLAHSYMTRSGRVDAARLREIAPRFMAEYERRYPAADRPAAAAGTTGGSPHER